MTCYCNAAAEPDGIADGVVAAYFEVFECGGGWWRLVASGGGWWRVVESFIRCQLTKTVLFSLSADMICGSLTYMTFSSLLYTLPAYSSFIRIISHLISESFSIIWS